MMHIPDMMLQGAICPATAALASVGLAGVAYAAYKAKVKPAASFFAGVTALVFFTLMADFAIACETCLVHKMPIPAPPEEHMGFAQPGFFTIAFASCMGIILMFAVVYGTRRMLAQKEQ
jgi:hypothetical protein